MASNASADPGIILDFVHARMQRMATEALEGLHIVISDGSALDFFYVVWDKIIADGLENMAGRILIRSPSGEIDLNVDDLLSNYAELFALVCQYPQYRPDL